MTINFDTLRGCERSSHYIPLLTYALARGSGEGQIATGSLTGFAVQDDEDFAGQLVLAKLETIGGFRPMLGEAPTQYSWAYLMGQGLSTVNAAHEAWGRMTPPQHHYIERAMHACWLVLLFEAVNQIASDEVIELTDVEIGELTTTDYASADTRMD